MRNKIAVILMLSLFGLSYAYAEESLSITTYYPSPYGSYNKLSTNRLAVGYLTDADQPGRDGDIRIKPQDGDPATDLAWVGTEVAKEGQIAYSSTNDALYVHNGNQWVRQGGGNPSSWNCSYVTGTNVSVAWWEHLEATAACPEGAQIITGGCSLHYTPSNGGESGHHTEGSYPVDNNSWHCLRRCQSGNTSAPCIVGTLTAYALCCS